MVITVMVSTVCIMWISCSRSGARTPRVLPRQLVTWFTLAFTLAVAIMVAVPLVAIR